MRKDRQPNNLAVAYARVSTSQQLAFGVSLEAQQERLTAYCKMAGLQLVNTFREEGVSASLALSERPAGSQLLAALSGGVCHAVTLKLDRLFRQAEEALRQTRLWDRESVSLHLVDFGGTSLNSASAVGRMMIGLLAGFAEFERDLIAERTTAALNHKKHHRQVFNHSPYGFRRVGDVLVPEEQEQTIVGQIQHLRAEGMTLASIADTLNQTGVSTKRVGGKWYPSTINNILGSSMHQSSLAE